MSTVDPENLESLYFSRQPAGITDRLKQSFVGIAGAGGLGSVVAENLVRAGVGKLTIADFDVVEPSNLNRQRYLVSQIGRPKVEALADNIRGFCPFVTLNPVRERVTADNCAAIFSGCRVIAECFDRAESKAELVSGLRSRLPDCTVVAASGLAGTGPGDRIKARRVSGRFYVVGDQESDADCGLGLFASRVGIAASMQAHLIIRLLAGVQTDTL